ncbi:hypothetical protein IL306_005711, partial [Fusarium sp. DS 682]
QSGSPILISGENKSIGVSSYGVRTKNSATVFRGKFRNYAISMSRTLHALDRAPSEDIKYIEVQSPHEPEMEERTPNDGEGFYRTFQKVAHVGSRIGNSVLLSGSPFLGPLGSPIAAVAGTALGVISKLGSDASIDIRSVHVNYRHHATRAILGEAAMQAVIMIHAQRANELRLFEKMHALYTKAKDLIPKVAKLITPAITEAALRISMKSQAAGEETPRLYPKLPPMANALQPEDKKFIEAFMQKSNQGDAPGMDEFMNDFVKTAVSVGPPNSDTITQKLEESEVANTTDMSTHVEILCHRALIGEAALQGLIAVRSNILVEESIFGGLVGGVRKIGRTVFTVAPTVTKSVMDRIKDGK